MPFVRLPTVEAARGRVIEANGRKFMATYHPASRFYRQDLAEKIESDFGLFEEELQRLRS